MPNLPPLVHRQVLKAGDKDPDVKKGKKKGAPKKGGGNITFDEEREEEIEEGLDLEVDRVIAEDTDAGEEDPPPE